MAVLSSIIIKDPDVLGGTPVFRGTRVPFQALLDSSKVGKCWMIFWMTFPQ